MGIMSLEWDPRERGSELEGYVGAFNNVYPPETESTNQITDETVISSPVANDNPLVDDSLLMEVSN